MINFHGPSCILCSFAIHSVEVSASSSRIWCLSKISSINSVPSGLIVMPFWRKTCRLRSEREIQTYLCYTLTIVLCLASAMIRNDTLCRVQWVVMWDVVLVEGTWRFLVNRRKFGRDLTRSEIPHRRQSQTPPPIPALLSSPLTSSLTHLSALLSCLDYRHASHFGS